MSANFEFTLTSWWLAAVNLISYALWTLTTNQLGHDARTRYKLKRHTVKPEGPVCRVPTGQRPPCYFRWCPTTHHSLLTALRRKTCPSLECLRLDTRRVSAMVRLLAGCALTADVPICGPCRILRYCVAKRCSSQSCFCLHSHQRRKLKARFCHPQ